jgi:putative FmdB family regulatory protein
MPTYEYVCQSCGTHVEVYQRFSDEPLTKCGACGGPLRKVFHPAGILFKGSGFYVTDSRSSRSGRSKGGAKSESGSSASDSAGSGGGSGRSTGDSGGSGGRSGGSTGDSGGSGGRSGGESGSGAASSKGTSDSSRKEQSA